MTPQHELPKILSRFRGAFFSVAVFTFFFNLLVLTLPLYMLSVFTRVLTSKSQETLILLTVAALAGLFLQALLDMVRTRVMVRIGMGLDAAVTPQVLEVVVRNASGTGSRETLPLRDLGEVRGFLSGSSVFTLFDAPFAPLYVAVIYILHTDLGHVALIGALALFTIGVVNEVGSRKTLKAIIESSQKTQARVDEFVRNADAIESMGMMPAALARWRAATKEGISATSDASDRASAASSFAKFVRFSLQIGLFGVGAYLYTVGELHAGALIAASILMGRALAPVESAISTWKNLVGAKAAYQRLLAVLTSDRYLKSLDRMKLPKPSGRIELERVIVMVPRSERVILKGVSLALNAGQFLGIIGPSGAGKTTLAKVLVGLIPPRGGSGARLDGAELSAWHPDDLGQYVGYLPQDIQLFPGTVRENIARMSQDGDPDDVVKAAKLAGVHETILGLPQGYDSEVGDAGRFLSAGQRQHIGLARAFYGDPVLLVLDEPNSNLDSGSEEALGRALLEAKQRGTTIVVVSHRPSTLQASDQLLLLKDGMAELYGPSADVMARMRQNALPQEHRQQLPAGPANQKPAPQGTVQQTRRQPTTEDAVQRPAQAGRRRVNGQRTGAGGAPSSSASGTRQAGFKTSVVQPTQQFVHRTRPAAPAAGNVTPNQDKAAKAPPVTIESSIGRAEKLLVKGDEK